MVSRVMNGLDRILDILVDGDWHTVRSLAANLSTPEVTLQPMLRFLSEHGFLYYRDSDSSVKIDSQLRDLMRE